MEARRVIVIGGGLSGLSAGIRLSQFGLNVELFERHSILGGLNSYYERAGRVYDTGLHAMTNVTASTERTLPLNVLLRQLRIRRDELQLCPQTHSEIQFPGARLAFDNDFATLEASVAQTFPGEIGRFRAFVDKIRQWNPFVTDSEFMPTLSRLEAAFESPLLRDMLAMPVMFYGNPMCHDMDFRQFCIIFRSMFLEGMGRPRLGMKPFIELLQSRFLQNGGVLHLRNGIARLVVEGGRVVSAVDSQGAEHQADAYLSCAGGPETSRLVQIGEDNALPAPPGEMGYAEFLFELSRSPAELGNDRCVIFRHGDGRFDYAPSREAVSLNDLVICAPDNFTGVESGEIRVTAIASPENWGRKDGVEYRAAKAACVQKVIEQLDGSYPGFSQAVTAWQMYTPRTFTRFTGRLNGSIYGSPVKAWDGTTPYANLHLLGTDQGYLGIVGALLSGVTIANGVLRTIV